MFVPIQDFPAVVVAEEHQHAFLALLPKLEAIARAAFASIRCRHGRADAVADVVAYGFASFLRLKQRGKDPNAFPVAFSKFVVMAVRNGRAIGREFSSRDVMSKHAQRRHDITVHRLDDPLPDQGGWWRDMVIDLRTNVADQAAFNVDFPEWMGTLPAVKQHVTRLLAAGYATDATAELADISAGRVRVVVRRCVASTDRRETDPAIVIRGGRSGVTLSAVIGEIAVICVEPGKCPDDMLIIPSSALAEFEGNGNDHVRLEPNEDGRGLASFGEAGSPQVRSFALALRERLPSFPALPDPFHPVEPGLLQALHDTTRTAAEEAIKFALNRVLLQGAKGTLVGTDSKQMLVVHGFHLPWTEDVLIPRVDVWDCLAADANGAAALGRNKDHVAVRAGSWTVVLKIDTKGRFPPYEQILPKLRTCNSVSNRAGINTAIDSRRATNAGP
jgi:hypothetical protein